MIPLTTLAHGLLALLHNQLAQGAGDGFAPISRIPDALPIEISEAYLRRALDEMLGPGYLNYDKSEDLITITDKGIKYFERQKIKEGSVIYEIDRIGEEYFLEFGDSKLEKKEEWRNPDYLGEISQSDVEEIKSLLKQILEALQQSDLSQGEYPQAAAPVRAGQELMEMPKPPLGKIRDLLRPLAHVAQIADLVKKILDLFSDG